MHPYLSLTESLPIWLSFKSLDPLSAFPRITGFKCIPSTHATSLDTNHLLIPIFGSEVGHALCFLYPRVPDHDIREHVASKLIPWFPLLGDGDGLLHGDGVNPVGFRVNRDGFPRRPNLLRSLGFVDEGCIFESRNGRLGNVLLGRPLGNCPNSQDCGWFNTHVDCQISVEQKLEIVVGGTSIPNDEACLEVILAEGNGIGQIEGVVPFTGVDHAIRETKVELDRRIAFAVGEGGRLGRGLAEIFPSRIASKAMLG